MGKWERFQISSQLCERLGWLVDTWSRGSRLQNLWFFRGDRFLAVRVLEQSVRNWLQEFRWMCWEPEPVELLATHVEQKQLGYL